MSPPPRSMYCSSSALTYGCVFGPCTVLNHTSESTIPSDPMNQKTTGQLNACVIQPMIGENRTSAKYCEELKTADANPRSAAGNQDATMRPLAGKMGDSVSPIASRKANRIEK